MPSFTVTARADYSGPLFSGMAPEDVRAWADGVKEDIAQEGVNELKSFVMNKTGRATGHYQSMITTTKIGYNDILIHDPVVYGPWLEGTSERNRSTRFRGYRLWRLTKQRLEGKVKAIAERHMQALITRLGGG